MCGEAATTMSTRLAALLPIGPAWPREYDSTLMALIGGLSQIWGDVDGRAADLLETESDPRTTVELLPDWERAWGLPDPCVKAAARHRRAASRACSSR